MIQIKTEFRNLIPPLSPDEYNQLEENIVADGCRDPLVVWRNGADWLVDGHNRLEICTSKNIDYKIAYMDFANESEAQRWIILNQFGRRNLSAFVRGELAIKLKPLFAAQAKERQIRKPKSVSPTLAKQIDTRAELAAIAGVAHGTVAKIEKILDSGTDEQIQDARSEKKSIHKVYQEIRDAEKKQERGNNLKQQIETINAGAMPQITGKYDVVVIDPPWPYGREYDPQSSRVANPYPEMSLDEIKNIALPAKDDSVLWLWTTHKFLPFSFELIKKWGYEYKATLVWNKQNIGMGAWLRMQCEFCLVGIKGKPYWENTTERDIITEARREHSRKPDAFYELVNKVCYGSKIDYFSRQTRDGWDSYGNDVEKF